MFGWITRWFGFGKEEVVAAVEVKEAVTESVPDSALEVSKPKKAKVTKPKKQVTPRTKLEGMTKIRLEEFARNTLNLELDRRKTKTFMIEQIQKAEKEN